MTNETQKTLEEIGRESTYSLSRLSTCSEVYKTLEDACSLIEIQGVPYADIWRFYGNNTPDETEVRVWRMCDEESLLEKLQKHSPTAFDQSGKIREDILKQLLISGKYFSGDYIELFKTKLADLLGYAYTPQQRFEVSECDDSWDYYEKARLEKKEREN